MTAAEIAARLAGSAGRDGFVPFDRFMDAALYSPGLGVYDRAASPLGTDGDFYTAAHVSPLWGATLAAHFHATARAAARPGPWRIVEVGAGDGALAASVLAALPPDGTFDEYVLIDRSTVARERALARARASAIGVRVTGRASLWADGPIRGIVFANELLDAMPARRLCRTAEGWKELGVRWSGERFQPAEADPAGPVPGPALATDVAAGTIVEVSPAGEAWVREVADHLAEGRAIIVDFGMGERELLRAHPSGTLAGVRRHRPVDDPLEAPGEVDLSTFVNFDRVRAAARGAGLAEVAFESQAEALGRWGFERVRAAALTAAADVAERVRLTLAAKNLLFGFERFRVLELTPASVDAPATGLGASTAPARPRARR